MQSNFRRRRLPLLVAAVCAAACPQAFAQIAPGALPTGWNVTSGNVSIVQNGSTLNINQTTSQALVNFATFNVGSGALVDIRQPGATSALLARTTGGDPSQIYGQIRANGALWLINPAGIMIGAGARIDVGSFIASTLNVSDSDFLAGRLTFSSTGNAGAVHNAGTINAASGGSIYLVAPSVVNTGALNAPKGEVLLAAGQNVQLIDTGTPGVSVTLSGAQGEVRNLGRIAAEAGRIGLAAGLVTNSGSLSADSAVSEGGRIFLRASNDLKTTASSDISANGTSGGNVVLYADGAAAIDGRVSATGSAGPGGYVDTSGQRSLDVMHAPVVGKGGEWHIDPYSLDVVAGNGSSGTTDTGVITSTGTGATIGADAITAQLDQGVSVTLATGPGGAPDAGNITVSAAIAKTAGDYAALTLRASNNITINAPITSTSGPLALNLNSNFQGGTTDPGHAATLNANLNLNGGALTVSQGEAFGNGTLNITGGTTTLDAPGSVINAAAVNIGSNAAMTVGTGLTIAGAWVNGGGVVVHDDGAISVGDPASSFTNNGTLTTTGTASATPNVLTGANGAGNFINNGTLVKSAAADQQYTYIASSASGTVRVDAGTLTVASSTLGGQVQVGSGAQLAVDTVQLAGGTAFSGAGTTMLQGGVTLLGNVDIATAVVNDPTRLVIVQGTGFALGTHGPVTLNGGNLLIGDGTGWNNYGAFTVGGLNPATLGFSGSGTFTNKAGGVLNVSDGSRLGMTAGTVVTNEAGGTVNVASTRTEVFNGGDAGRLINGGMLVKTGSGSVMAPLVNQAGGVVSVQQGGLGVNFPADNANAGTIDIAAGATLQSGGRALYNNGLIGGSGTIALGGSDGATLFNNGVVAPGSAVATGTLSVQGGYVQGANGVLNIRLGSDGADLLDIDGSAQLAGTLNLSTLGGVLPANDAMADFVVARGANNSGSFSQVNAPAVVSDSGTATLSVSYPVGGSTVARATAAAVPSVSACTSNPALPRCATVLPSLDQCIANGALAGCSAVLPTAAVCMVSPSTKGCAPVVATPTPTPPPSADICTIAPNSALCQVLSPPTASDPVKPVQQASNEVIRTVVSASTPSSTDISFLPTPGSTGSTSDAKTDDGKTASTGTGTGASTGTTVSSAPAKKMYCN